MCKIISVTAEKIGSLCNRKTIIGLDTSILFSMFYNTDEEGNNITYSLFQYPLPDSSDDNIAELLLQLIHDFAQNSVSNNPKIILNIDIGTKRKEISLDVLLSLLKIITNTCKAELLWNVTESERNILTLELLVPVISTT